MKNWEVKESANSKTKVDNVEFVEGMEEAIDRKLMMRGRNESNITVRYVLTKYKGKE